MKKTFFTVIFLLLITFALSSCKDEKAKEVIGMSLLDAGYQLNFPSDLEIEDSISFEQWSNTGENYCETKIDKILGEDKSTSVSVFFYGPHSLGSEPLSFMCLQAFAAKDAREINFVKIGEETYTFKELKPYLLLKLNDICIYDLYTFVYEENLQTKINEHVDIHNGMVEKCVNATEEEREKYNILMTAEDYVSCADYNYLIDIADYYKENMSVLITKRP